MPGASYECRERKPRGRKPTCSRRLGRSLRASQGIQFYQLIQMQGVLQMATQQSRIYNLALDEEQREELLQVLEQCATETRDEMRHTDSSQYRERISGEESRLQTLLEKVRRLTSLE